MLGLFSIFESEIFDAWQDKVTTDLSAREGFRGGPLLDIAGTLQLLNSFYFRERDEALLRGILVGGVWNGFLLERVRGQLVSSRFFGGPDGDGHLFGNAFFFLLRSVKILSFMISFFHLSDEQQPKLNKKFMENLHYSANNGGEGTYDVLHLPTGYEPKAHDFDELQNSSVPLSFKIPITDQDVDDLTLGEMLTEAYRGQVDYFVQEGVSVSQSSSSVRFDRSGQPDGEMVDRSGRTDECNSSKAQIRTLLEEQS